MRKNFLVPALATLALVGCSSKGSTDSAEGQNLEATATRDVPANNCEIFIDKVEAIGGDHGTARVHVWLKTLNDRLDGTIVRVGFLGKLSIQGVTPPVTDNPSCRNLSDCDRVGVFSDYAFQSFVGAPDYWENAIAGSTQDFYLENDFISVRSYEGAFYVKTDKGTTYWLNAPESSGDRNFHFDRNMWNNVSRLQAQHGTFEPFGADPSRAIVAADEFPYLNTNKCR